MNDGHGDEAGGRRAGTDRRWRRVLHRRLTREDWRRAIDDALETEAAHGHGFLWLALLFVLGAAAWRALTFDPDGYALAGFFGISLVAALAWNGAARRLAVAFTFLAAGLVAGEWEGHRDAVTVMDSPIVTNIVGRVVAREIDHRGHWRYTIDVVSTRDPEIGRRPERVRMLARSDHDPVEIGGLIEGLGRLSPPSGPAMPGTFDFAFYSYFQGLGAYGFYYGAPRAVGETSATTALGALQRRTRELRESIAFRIRAILPGEAGAVAAAMTVSDRRAISPATIDAFRQTGLAHILAISGLHMSLAAAIMFAGLRLVLAPVPGLVERFAVKKLAAAGALLSSTFYLAISGAVISAQRAWIMIAVMLVAVLIDRAALTLRNVAVAAFVIVAISPSAVTSPGFQMSFAATAALIATYGAWSRRRSERTAPPDVMGRAALWWALAPLVGIAATALIAGLATGIFSAHHFHRMAGYGMVANVLAMPIISMLVMPMLTLALLVMPFGMDHLPLLAAGWGLDATIGIAHWVSRLGADFVTGRIPLAVTGLLAAALSIAVLMRTWLRGAAIVPAALAALLILAGPDRRPEILVSEDGRLVALRDGSVLASNRSRPSQFIFEQWTTALRMNTHRPPGTAVDTATDTEFEMTEAAASGAKGLRFKCDERGWCAGRAAGGALVVTVEEPEFIGAACDVADLVVTPVPIAMRECYSGAMLLTGQSLRQSGAVSFQADRQWQPRDQHRIARANPRSSEPAEVMKGYRIETAVGGIVRRWTVHRYYDWRSRSFITPRTLPGDNVDISGSGG